MKKDWKVTVVIHVSADSGVKARDLVQGLVDKINAKNSSARAWIPKVQEVGEENGES